MGRGGEAKAKKSATKNVKHLKIRHLQAKYGVVPPFDLWHCWDKSYSGTLER
jgi:hypothetical protein